MKQGIIYKYTSPSGKSYIGQTTDENWRKIHHKGTSRKTKFSTAIKKYGFENFKYEIVFQTIFTDDLVKLKSILNTMEIAFIEYYDTFNNGYNLTKGGEGTLGVKLSKESLEKRKQSRRLKDPTWGDKLIKAEYDLKREIANAKRNEKLLKLEKRRRPKILQYNLDGEFIAQWDSLAAIHRVFGISTQPISDCCKNKRESFKKCIWKYEDKLFIN